MFYYSNRNKFADEIEDTGDIGNMICSLLRHSSVKEELWEIFDDLLHSDSLEGLEDALKYWVEEREE
ncbi:unnamed protein product [marine sediment metagenome]|uniref:Uncharacterized protein n=1 Tax=marine sediment metagenome TaxID=412755 RepID=X1PIY7_9ZZZZ